MVTSGTRETFLAGEEVRNIDGEKQTKVLEGEKNQKGGGRWGFGFSSGF